MMNKDEWKVILVMRKTKNSTNAVSKVAKLISQAIPKREKKTSLRNSAMMHP